MKSFEDWYSLLISDTIWYELLRAYKPDTIKKAGEKVFAQLVADSTVEVRPMSENRKHVYNILIKNPGDKPVLKNWAAKALEIQEEEKKKEWVPLTGEERARRLAEWEAIVKGSTMLNSMPKPSYKELAEEGGVLPPKPAPYPCTSKEEAYVRDRHFEYIKYAYEPRTGLKRPEVISEEEFNIMTLQELIQLTDKLPSYGMTNEGIRFEIDVAKNGKLGYIASMWEVEKLGVKEYRIEYGTGKTPDAAKESLKKKIMKTFN